MIYPGADGPSPHPTRKGVLFGTDALALHWHCDFRSACDASNGGTVKVLGLPDGSLTALGMLGRYLVPHLNP